VVKTNFPGVKLVKVWVTGKGSEARSFSGKCFDPAQQFIPVIVRDRYLNVIDHHMHVINRRDRIEVDNKGLMNAEEKVDRQLLDHIFQRFPDRVFLFGGM
jgi:hypothetical protein